MGWIEELRHRRRETAAQSSEDQFAEAARRRWASLREELNTDIAEFNAHGEEAGFFQVSDTQYRVRNPKSGLQLDLTADFSERVVRYSYSALNKVSAGVPEGGILSIRQSRLGAAEFYSADERLSSEETRQVLLEPVLFPPMVAA
jgi:hypothetical protein